MEKELEILHGFAGKLLIKYLHIVHEVIYPHLEKMRQIGFESEFTRKLDRALDRFVLRFQGIPQELRSSAPGRPESEIAQETSILPELKEDFRKIADIVVTIAEMEKYHFPRWLSWLFEDLKKEGVI